MRLASVSDHKTVPAFLNIGEGRLSSGAWEGNMGDMGMNGRQQRYTAWPSSFLRFLTRLFSTTASLSMFLPPSASVSVRLSLSDSAACLALGPLFPLNLRLETWH